MLKKLLITTAVSGLMLSSALAQSPMSPSAPGAASSGSSASDSMKSDTSKSDASKSSASAGAASGNIVSSQKPDQWLASSFEGTDVLGSDNQKIGDVSDVLFTKDGKIEAYVISVGGFLGVGAKDVALAPSAFQVVPGEDKSADKLKITMNKDQLAQAPDFEKYRAARTTTGAAPGGPGGTMAPRAAPNAAPGGGAGGAPSTR